MTWKLQDAGKCDILPMRETIELRRLYPSCFTEGLNKALQTMWKGG